MSGNMWQRYKVTWEFNNRLCGSFPLSKDMIQPWLDARKPASKPQGARSMEEIAEEAAASITESDPAAEALALEERTTLGFQRFDDYLVMRSGTVKAHLKDCARVLSSFSDRPVKGSGERSFAVKAVNCIYPDEYWVPILKNGKGIKISDGTFDKAVHVNTPQGPRNALKRIHYVEKPTLIFHLNVLTTTKGEVLSQEELEKIFEYGAIHGYAGERGDGEGRYTYTIELDQASPKREKSKIRATA